MGEARRRKLAGYVKPEAQPKEVKKPFSVGIVGGRQSLTMAMAMSLMSEYPKLPNQRTPE